MKKQALLKRFDRDEAELKRQRNLAQQIELGVLYEFKESQKTWEYLPSGKWGSTTFIHLAIPMDFNKNSVRAALLASDHFFPKNWDVKDPEWYQTKKFWIPIQFERLQSVRRVKRNEVSLYIGLKHQTPYLERFFKGEMAEAA